MSFHKSNTQKLIFETHEKFFKTLISVTPKGFPID